MEGYIYSGFGNGNGTQVDGKVLQTFQKSFVQVQDILDQNRLLINEINQNHESKIPDNLSRNVGLIKELNNNIRRVADLYTDLSSSFTRPIEASPDGDSATPDGKASQKRIRSGWSQIATQLPGKTDNEIKNLWNSCLKKKLRQRGINHVTHNPLSEVENEEDNKIQNATSNDFKIKIGNNLKQRPALNEQISPISNTINTSNNNGNGSKEFSNTCQPSDLMSHLSVQELNYATPNARLSSNSNLAH